MSDKITRQQAIQALINSDKVCLTAIDIAPIIGTDPQTIRDTARQRPELLKFAFFVTGNRVKIPRIPFLQYIGINVDNLVEDEKPNSETDNRDVVPVSTGSMTNEELLFLITQQIDKFKEEINQRLDSIEQQSQDLNMLLQSARNFINALSGFHTDN